MEYNEAIKKVTAGECTLVSVPMKALSGEHLLTDLRRHPGLDEMLCSVIERAMALAQNNNASALVHVNACGIKKLEVTATYCLKDLAPSSPVWDYQAEKDADAVLFVDYGCCNQMAFALAKDGHLIPDGSQK